jgi:hypothetical protein
MTWPMRLKSPMMPLLRGCVLAAALLGLAGCALHGEQGLGPGPSFGYAGPPVYRSAPPPPYGYYRGPPPSVHVRPPVFGYQKPYRYGYGRPVPPGRWGDADLYRPRPFPPGPPIYAGPGVFGPSPPRWGHDRYRARAYRGNGRCDDPRYETSNGGRARAGTDEYDCSRHGDGLKGRYR